MNRSNLRQMIFSRRAVLLGGLQAAVGGLVVGRMAWIALAEGDRLRDAAEDNRVALRLIPPRRGILADATGLPLALNRPAYGVELTPSLAGDMGEVLERIGRIIPLAADQKEEILKEAQALRGSATLMVADDIGWEAYAALNVELADVPGVLPVKTYVRSYPGGEGFAHALGYVGRPTREQYLESRNPLYMFPGFRLGKDGVERALDDRLQGQPGARRVEVNARGRILRDLETRPDVAGESIQLTLDYGLQDFMARRIGGDSASVVVIDCTTGHVKCLLSMPAFDPNIFSNRIPSDLWKALQADDRKPLIAKATQGLYVPGSTFKMVTAMAALAEGVATPGDRVTCGGRYTVGGNTWHCHSRRGHGTLALQRAIAASCNVYFYTMGRRAGPEAVARMARHLGVGEKFDLPIPSLKAGIVPDPAWKEKRFGQEWQVGDTLNTAIGQGYLFVSPIQLAVMTARIASGRIVQPSLLVKGEAPAFPPLGIAEDVLDVVRAGMSDVVNGPGGTARRASLSIPGVRMAGKTGTAQVRRITAAERRRGVRRNESLPWRLRDHALFVGFAPADAPRYAVAVVVEHGASGSRAAAPLAKAAMTYIYDRPQAEEALRKEEAARERRRLAAEAAARRAAEAAALAAAAPATADAGAAPGAAGAP
ncbi:penicillin-binding protein 2 [Thermaurantiacus sp.]